MTQQPPSSSGNNQQPPSQPYGGQPYTQAPLPPNTPSPYAQPQQYGMPPQQPYGRPQTTYGESQAHAQQPYGWPYGAPGAVQKTPMSQGARTWGWIAAVAGVLAIIGCFGAWVTIDAGLFGNISMNGYGQVSGAADQSADGVTDGVLVTIFAVLAIIVGVVRGMGKLGLTAAITTLVLGLLNLAISIYDVSDVTDTFAGSNIGWGLWLCLITAIAMCVAGLVGIVKRR